MFCARTDVASTLDAATVIAGLDGLLTRWNQFGVSTRMAAQAAPSGGLVVRYRLSVDGRADPPGVHAAFRGDLDLALERLAAPPPPPPVSWDLEALAKAAVELEVDVDVAAALPSPPRLYVQDGSYDWNG